MRFSPPYRSGQRIDGRFHIYRAHLEDLTEVYQCLDLARQRPCALKPSRLPIFTKTPACSRPYSLKPEVGSPWVSTRTFYAAMELSCLMRGHSYAWNGRR